LTSADITKYACILFFKEILNRDWLNIVKIINLVHDEICIEAPEEIIEEAAKILVYCMEKSGEPFCKIVPLKATVEIGDYWIH
jgi:DNA polymerase-1